MSRLRNASLFAAVVSGDYAVLMLIDGQLIDFGVTAAICAGSAVAAGLIAYAEKRRRKAVARGRAAVWERRDQQVAADQRCPFCGGAGQKPSASPRFVDRQRARVCGKCALALNAEPGTMSPRPVSARVLISAQPDRVRRSTASPAWASREIGWGRGAPDDPGVEVLT
ncbi:MAG TPA: hypothetical protein VN856_02910 [Mycobacterium sp.]|uniref:hypothetical protein n=1 Tax=Mycobacterium sp. TaxID=1785 RepID=UPI002C4E78F8|nr:hypothetical protein [Mycobacterium sp.]HXO78819.1 hypothetical protein [Mycobacterium sp.]